MMYNSLFASNQVSITVFYICFAFVVVATCLIHAAWVSNLFVGHRVNIALVLYTLAGSSCGIRPSTI
ncbi:hypothetical protein F5Y13DRAFT_152611 [Hypoxylon sp. FL1857]|nr:hypothetical protein F5Y13DRAFT_152611 [Hypoxylon sp. FL1857]